MIKIRKKRIIPVIVVLVTLSILGYFLILKNDDGNYIVSGTVEAKEVDISPKIAGRIDNIFADEGDMVKKGQLLLQMDDRQVKIQVERAKAGLNSAGAVTRGFKSRGA